MGEKKFRIVSSENSDASNLTELHTMRNMDYFGFFNHNDWLAHATRYAHVTQFVESNKRKVSKILDVGSGDLNLARYMWRNRSTFEGSMTCLDLRAQETWLGDENTIGYRAMNWKPVDIELVRADIVNDPVDMIPLGDADVTVCFEVFEHVHRDKQAELLRRLNAWTRPGGTVFFSTPNHGVSTSVAENHVGPEGVRERSYDEKIEMVQATGFEVVETFGTFITLKNMPEEFKETEFFKQSKKYLPYAWFTVLAAAPFPTRSNNSMFVLKKKE